MKKILMTATVPSMIGQFNMNNIDILLDMGYEVHVACNFRDYSYWSEERIREFIKELRKIGVKYHQIGYTRSPVEIKKILTSFYQLDRLMKQEKFAFVHCHTPVAGVVSRICSHRNGVKVIYTAHGFHFYNGAPIKNWLIFFPVEYLCAYWTDVLITINKEDYKRAKEKFHARKIVYIPGVGVDTKKFRLHYNRGEIRKELGIPEDALLLVSVGELNRNKNHSVVIRAVAKLENLNIHYAIAGKGSLRDDLESLAESLNIEKRVHILGFRTDIPELYNTADICIFPSIREGLPFAAIEGMASGLPLIVSNNRGTKEFQAEDTTITCQHDDVDGFAKAILKLAKDPVLRKRMGDANQIKSADFDVSVITPKMIKLYEGEELK